MQLITAQQYLIKTNQYLIYHFFLDKDKSLNYSIYDSDNVLLKSKTLISFAIDFSVAIDSLQRIHLICITKEGELLYYINQDNQWSNKTISKLDIKSNIYRYLLLYVHNNYTHIIYTKTNLLTPMLSYIEHIYWNQNGLNRTIVGNYLHGKYPSPIQVSVDSLKNLHLIYKIYHKNNHQLCYSTFNIITRKWTSSELVSNIEEDHSHPYIFIDKKDILHIVWCTIEQNNFILKYKRKDNLTNSKKKWSNPQILSNKNSNNHSPILFQELETLKIYCKQNNQIVGMTSEDEGNTWKALDSNLYKIEDPKIIKYSYAKDQDNTYFIEHVYGSVNNKINLVGVNLFANSKETSPIEYKTSKIEPSNSNLIEQNIVVNKTDKSLATDDIILLVKDIEKKIDRIMSQICELEPNSKLQGSLNNEYDFEPIEVQQSKETLNELLSNYKVLEKQLIEIEEETKRFAKTMADSLIELNILEEKIIDYKKQILTLDDKINKLIKSDSMVQRFINFFK